MSKLEFCNVNKVYPNGYQAVSNFNLTIEDGEFICLVGSSGCGKSTTLRMVAGLEDITSGDFVIDGKRANQRTSRERGIAMVFQSYALYPHLTVAENLAFRLNLEGTDGDIMEQKVQKTADMLGLSQYLNRFPRELSGGQRQRVAVGRALIRKANVFLMDEPLSNLDAKQRVTMRSEIKQVHRTAGATTIYVTHDQTEAMTMADRIVVMERGKIMQVGTPHDLYFYPDNLFVAAFIGEPPMNFIYGKVRGGVLIGDNDPDIRINVQPFCDKPAQIEGKAVVFAFRPESAVVSGGGEGATLQAKVTLAELLGDTANVYAMLGKTQIVLKCDPKKTPKIGKDFCFFVPQKAGYLYDAETEQVIPCSIKRGER